MTRDPASHEAMQTRQWQFAASLFVIAAVAIGLGVWRLGRERSEIPNEIPAKKSEGHVTSTPPTVAFRDDAHAAGIDFNYFNGTTATAGLDHILQSTGGGIAVLDYDADGWPDIYLAQSGPWPVAAATNQYRDRLYRNLGNGRFADVTDQAGLGDDLYSQGAAAGDFDNDGFTDLFVANVGPNRLYRNNGDGTFSEIAYATDDTKARWSVSAAFADVNGDGFPELFVVNYLNLEQVLARTCERKGIAMSCAPTYFDGEFDRLHLNMTDGTFQNVTSAAGVKAEGAKGLGVVAADFDGSGRVSLFVTNDTTANFLFRNESQPGGIPHFTEQAVAMGLAYDETGRPQSSMGVAAGDVDGDGLLDLYVTNYYADFNTLYLQGPRGTFRDVTRDWGLVKASFNLLGFGCQFLDADLDGELDLVVTNGHIDRTAVTGEPDRMTPQFFHNRRKGRLRETPAATLGPYFENDYLGRGLALLDWNRDGRPDFCVSHLDAPFALLTNRTPDAGHFLAVRLVGTRGSREPIGARVTLRTQARTLTSQLASGDGYACSNERVLRFGLGSDTRIEELTVTWPNGERSVFQNVEADREIVIVEGSRHAVSVN